MFCSTWCTVTISSGALPGNSYFPIGGYLDPTLANLYPKSKPFFDQIVATLIDTNIYSKNTKRYLRNKVLPWFICLFPRTLNGSRTWGHCDACVCFRWAVVCLGWMPNGLVSGPRRCQNTSAGCLLPSPVHGDGSALITCECFMNT